jgi:integral membrane sensor domain MASE1
MPDGSPQPPPPPPGVWSAGTLLKVGVVAAAYCLTGAVGLLLAIPPGYATAVWPPSGVALAALLWWGPRVAPGVWLGAFLVNVWAAVNGANGGHLGAGVAVAASIGVGSTLQAVLGAFLLRRWVGADRLFERGSAILAFAGVVAAGCTLAPTWGVTTLAVAGVVDWAAYFDSWRTWWLGDLMGVLLVTPVALTWRQLLQLERRPLRVAEAVGSLGLLAAVAAVVFAGPSPLASGDYPLAFLPLPCLVWIASRFAPGGVAVASLLLSTIAVGATSTGSGPFVRDLTAESLFLLQAFTGLATMTGLTLAAAVRGRQRAEAEVRQLNAGLEERVRERTAELAAAVGRLQQAVAEIKTLKGLVPICGWCKKIRDDSGFWQHLESYLRAHTEAEFTHGMCPACMKQQLDEITPFVG